MERSNLLTLLCHQSVAGEVDDEKEEPAADARVPLHCDEVEDLGTSIGNNWYCIVN